MIPDVAIRVYFLKPNEGGRTKSIDGTHYNCPMFIQGNAFDCRIFLDGTVILPGMTYELTVKFLNLELAQPFLATDQEIALWEGRNIATGRIIKILYDETFSPSPQ
ncbi:hypothetical protein [Lysobacter enzymogenes]|uniref:hypothetical protein n=1 Tax=Lysobacter enzymogenes TaxID=69 RepID=UPI0011141D9A|nr:hypothetical protein [Lysobacter enzymogenes]